MKGNLEAISAKVYGLIGGKHGYEQSPQAIQELNNQLVEAGDPNAIERKVVGLTFGRYGYIQNPQTARELNDQLVEAGNCTGIKIKLEGLLWGRYCYEKNHQAARELNDQLVEAGDLKAIERKLNALTGEYIVETYGYTQNFQNARALNDKLVEMGDSTAIQRKLTGVTEGKYGYDRNPYASEEFIEISISRGSFEMIRCKMEALVRGNNNSTYLSSVAIRNLCNNYSNNHYYHYSNTKTNVYPSYGYEKNPNVAKMFIEELLVSKFPLHRGIGKYIKAFSLKHGVTSLGYEKDEILAAQFIRTFNVPY